MRKILYSPGHGDGWVSWHSDGSLEEKLFMLEYEPFIKYIESGGEFKPAYINGYFEFEHFHPKDLVEQFKTDWKEKFKNADLPYLGGLLQLSVKTVNSGTKVRIRVYRGSESVHEDRYMDWL